MPQWKGIVNRQLSAEQFDAYVKTLKLNVFRPQFVVLHNTGNPLLSEWGEVSEHQRMLNLEHYYRDIMGWSAGPHLFVSDRSINLFTPLTVPGVHSPSWNHVSWGVEMVGDYNTEPFGPKVEANVVAALATLHAAAGLDSSSLRLHKEDPVTTHKECPGKNVNKATIIQQVHDLILKRHPGEHLPDRR